MKVTYKLGIDIGKKHLEKWESLGKKTKYKPYFFYAGLLWVFQGVKTRYQTRYYPWRGVQKGKVDHSILDKLGRRWLR